MRNFFILVFFTTTILFTGCKSGSISFKEGLEQQQFQADLFVPRVDVATIDYSGMGIIAEEGFKSMYKDHIEKIYLPVKMDKIVQEAWKSNPPNIKERIEFMATTVSFAGESSIFIEDAQDQNERALDYDYSKIQNKVKSPYVLEYRVKMWGYHPMYNMGMLEYQATLVNMESNEIEWRMTDKYLENYDLGLTGDAEDITQEMVEEMMKNLVNESFQYIQEELIQK